MSADYDQDYEDAVRKQIENEPKENSFIKWAQGVWIVLNSSYRPFLWIAGIVLGAFILYYCLVELPKYIFNFTLVDWFGFLSMTQLRRDFDMLRTVGRHYYARKVYAYRASDAERNLINKIGDYLSVAMEYELIQNTKTGVALPDTNDVQFDD